MTKILPIGSILKTDSRGYLINESSLDDIKTPWNKLVADVAETCLQNLESQVHSIYIRGSVARNNAIEGISDLDCYCVYTGVIADRTWKSRFIKAARSKYPFCTKVEVLLVPYDELLNAKKDEFERFVIATQACCIYGKNLAPQFGQYKINQAIAFHLRLIKKEINRTIDQLQHSNATENQARQKCRWIMKRILRSGLELVMEREGVFTRDLYPCFEIYSKYYPRQKQDMHRTLELAINPTSEKEMIITHLTDFGQTLIGQLKAASETSAS